MRSSTRSSTCGQIDRRRAGSSLAVFIGQPLRGLQVGHVLDRARPPRARCASRWPGCTTVTWRAPPRNVATSSGGRTVADSPTRCARPPSSGAAQRVEPFERQCQVRAPLVARHRVHLVDDHRLDPAQYLPGLGGEQQEQRLRRGDQDVRRAARELAPFVGRGVPGADRDADVGLGQPEPVRRLPDPGQRRAQVPLDVHRERLQRRDVQHPAAPLPVGGRRRRGEPVDRPQERGERLPRPGGRDDQRVVLPARSRPPMARHACACACVGTAKAPSNHARVAGENPSRASALLTGGCAAIPPYCLHPPTFRSAGDEFRARERSE